MFPRYAHLPWYRRSWKEIQFYFPQFNQNANAPDKLTLTSHLRVVVKANFKAILKLGDTHKGTATQTTKSGQNEKIVQELWNVFSRVANTFPFRSDRNSEGNGKWVNVVKNGPSKICGRQKF